MYNSCSYLGHDFLCAYEDPDLQKKYSFINNFLQDLLCLIDALLKYISLRDYYGVPTIKTLTIYNYWGNLGTSIQY